MRHTYQIWDGKTPVNGVSADELRETYKIKGSVFIIYDDDKVQVFQPYNPEAGGLKAMTEAEAHQYAQAMVDRLNVSAENTDNGEGIPGDNAD
jgi:hypothetical protein